MVDESELLQQKLGLQVEGFHLEYHGSVVAIGRAEGQLVR